MKILVIEDDTDIAANLGQFFETRGVELDYAYNGRLGLRLAVEQRFDLVILDLMLPGLDGIEVCRRIRSEARHDTPILMLTARDTIDDKVLGFDAGADDYLVKPFSLRELDARVQALVRRGDGRLAERKLLVGDLELNRLAMTVEREGISIRLKPMSFRVLEYLMQNAGRVVGRAELGEHLWPDGTPRGDPLRVHIHDLRRRIDKPFDSELIHTVHGVGYRVGDADEH